MRRFHILPTPEEAAQAAAAFVVALAEEWVASQGRFTIALSGGSTPRRLYQQLASPPFAGRAAWERWHVFWSDERCVPPGHRESNYRLAKEALLDRVAIPAAQVYRLRGEAAPAVAAQEYEAALRRVFQAERPAFDLVLLGVGEDGHTASLFLGTSALHETRRLVVANWVPQLEAQRLTFTLPFINAARAVAFLATDGSKAEVVRRVLAPTTDEPLPPAALVRPASGSVHWFLTRGAASQLEGAAA